MEESSTAVDEGFADADETLYVTGSNVNVRRVPATTGEIAGTLNKGASLHCTGRKDDWSRVEYNGEICFVSSQFLSAEKPEETKPAAQAGTGIYHAGGDILVCIDAGHQDHQMTDKEPNGPRLFRDEEQGYKRNGRCINWCTGVQGESAGGIEAPG